MRAQHGTSMPVVSPYSDIGLFSYRRRERGRQIDENGVQVAQERLNRADRIDRQDSLSECSDTAMC